MLAAFTLLLAASWLIPTRSGGTYGEDGDWRADVHRLVTYFDFDQLTNGSYGIVEAVEETWGVGSVFGSDIFPKQFYSASTRARDPRTILLVWLCDYCSLKSPGDCEVDDGKYWGPILETHNRNLKWLWPTQDLRLVIVRSIFADSVQRFRERPLTDVLEVYGSGADSSAERGQFDQIRGIKSTLLVLGDSRNGEKHRASRLNLAYRNWLTA